MKRKVIGTNKFIVYFYNGKAVRGGDSKPEHFVYQQWGRVSQLDENNNQVGESYAFTNYGEMISFINKIMRNSIKKNLREKKAWRKG